MHSIRISNTKRSGAAVVEMAVVLLIFLMFLFGILEYCRYMYHLQIMDNAAREGARFVVVSTYTYGSNLEEKTKEEVLDKLVGANNSLENFEIQVYQSDQLGNNIGPAADAEFGEFIAVKIEGDYSPVLPSFLFLGNKIPIKSIAIMGSEAN